MQSVNARLRVVVGYYVDDVSNAECEFEFYYDDVEAYGVYDWSLETRAGGFYVDEYDYDTDKIEALARKMLAEEDEGLQLSYIEINEEAEIDGEFEELDRYYIWF